MRRIIATAAAGLIALTTLAAPTAQAQNADTLALVAALNGNIKTMDCRALGLLLNGVGLVSPETTRGELVANTHKLVGDDAGLRLASAPTINTLGDRALECGLVKADPVTPIDQAIAASSQMSSQAGIPEIRNLLPALQVAR